jgi:hypothetical protein
MANGNETYTEVLAGIRDRLNGIDDRLTSLEERVTSGASSDRADAVVSRQDFEALRNVVNHQQTAAASNYSKQVAVCGGRFDKLEDFKKGVITIKDAVRYVVATTIAAAGVASGIAALVVKLIG